NARYFYSQTLGELERLKSLGIKVEVDGMTEDRLGAYLHELQQDIHLAQYRHSCLKLLDKIATAFHYPAPRLFLVLPVDLDSWNDSDPTTHSFRLYFLCDNRMEDSAPEDMPQIQHVHLSNHAGYSIKQSQEFFQVYGDYVLRILQMIKCGYSNDHYYIPPLDTFKILQGHDSITSGNRLSKVTITSLVSKAIAYLQRLSPPKWIKNTSLTEDQSATIKTYLDISSSTTATGNLQLYIRSGQLMCWTCEEHTLQRLDQGMLSGLKAFTQSRGGFVNMQQAILKVNLGSETEAMQFFSLLKGSKHKFHISIKLNWKATRASVKKLLDEIASTDTVSLELDGITLDAHPQGHVQYVRSIIERYDVLSNGKVLFVALLNYPRPQEACYYFDGISIQSTSSLERPGISLLTLVEITINFWKSVDAAHEESAYRAAASELQSALERVGLPEVTVVGYFKSGRNEWVGWNSIFDLKELAFVEVYSNDMSGRTSALLSESLKRLTVHLSDLQQCKELSRVVQANALLLELNVSYYGHDVLYYVEHIVKIWLDSSTSSRLTLIDRMADTQGQIIAQLVRLPEIQFTEPSITLDIDTIPSSRQRPATAQPSIDSLQWDCDQIVSQLHDYSALIIDMATNQHPSLLTLLTLDVSELTRHGLASVEKILARSSLEHLHVVCTPLDPSMSDSVVQVLGSVPWPTLKSLKLSGEYIDAWIRLGMDPHCCPFTSDTADLGTQLHSLRIEGLGSVPQLLSHTSALFVHGLVYSSPSIESRLENVELVEQFLE
ncbi:hypothetical protein BG000_005271, partial [Podila horticola]